MKMGSMDNKPWGNSNSLVPEISGRGVNGMDLKPQMQGKIPEPKMVRTISNKGYTSFKNTGQS